MKVVSTKNDSCRTFNDLKVKLYHQSMKKIFIELPCSSNSIQQNIKRAYLQTRLWLEAPFRNASESMDFNEFGHITQIDGSLIEPLLFVGPARSIDVPEPCKCKICVKKNMQLQIKRIIM